MAIDTINASSSVSPVIGSGTGNSITDIRSYQRMRAQTVARTAEFQQQIVNDTAQSAGLADNELLSLSPQSLDLLNGIAPAKVEVQTNANPAASAQQAGTATATTPAAQQVPQLPPDLNLTSIQRENLASIISEFKDAPFNQNTFLQIQNALLNARINPQQISLQGILQQAFTGALPNSYYGKTRTVRETYELESAA